MCSIPYVQQRVCEYFGGVDVLLPRVATLQDCVAIGCSRPVDLELSNRKHCSWSVGLQLTTGALRSVFDAYAATFDWLVAYTREPYSVTVRIPEGTDLRAVVFEDARTGKRVCSPVSLPRDTSRPTWQDDVTVSFGKHGLHLVRGRHKDKVTDLPWFSEAERHTCEEHWRSDQERLKRGRQAAITSIIKVGRDPDQDPG